MSQPPPPFSQPVPLSYAPGSAHRSRSRFSWSIFAWSGAVVGIWLLIVMIVLPRFQQTFKESGIELPLSTRALYAVQRIASSPIWLLLALSIPVAFGFATGPLGPGAKRAFRLGLTLALGGLIVLTVLGIFQPLAAMMENLTNVRQ